MDQMSESLHHTHFNWIKSLQKGENIYLNARLLSDDLIALYAAGGSGKSCTALQRAGEQKLSLCSSAIKFHALLHCSSLTQIPNCPSDCQLRVKSLNKLQKYLMNISFSSLPHVKFLDSVQDQYVERQGENRLMK